MNRKNDLSNDLDSSGDNPRDPLADRLQSEAMAMRPLFSNELHDRIMERIHETDSAAKLPHAMLRGRLIATALAAGIVAALGVTALWIEHLHRPSMRNHEIVVADHVVPQAPNNVQPAIAAGTPPISLAVDFGGVFSARFWPPQIIVSLPLAQSSLPYFSEHLPTKAAPVIRLPGSPEWLLARLQEQTDNAQAALTDVIPPEARILLRQANN